MLLNRPARLVYPTLAAVCLFLAQTACTRKEITLPATVSVVLNSGIPDVVVLGDSEQQVLKHLPAQPERAPATIFTGPDAIKMNEIWSYPDQGLRLYFLNSRVEMIELQQPFLGKVRGTLVRVFQFERPKDTPWDEFIIKGFGEPIARAAGGKFGSEALFYPWGDISYNSMGPNQVALYKTPEIQNYRLNNFGKSLQLFQTK